MKRDQVFKIRSLVTGLTDPTKKKKKRVIQNRTSEIGFSDPKKQKNQWKTD